VGPGIERVGIGRVATVMAVIGPKAINRDRIAAIRGVVIVRVDLTGINATTAINVPKGRAVAVVAVAVAVDAREVEVVAAVGIFRIAATNRVDIKVAAVVGAVVVDTISSGMTGAVVVVAVAREGRVVVVGLRPFRLNRSFTTVTWRYQKRDLGFFDRRRLILRRSRVMFS
jgi:hypothetical protein